MRNRLDYASLRSVWSHSLARLGALASIAATSLVASVSPAAATVTIGQVGPPLSCGGPTDWVQPTVTAGNSYVAKGGGTITSWSTIGTAAGASDMKLKVFRPVAGLTYTVVAQETRNVAANVLNTFPTSIAVKAGDVLGLNSLASGAGCVFVAPGETSYFSAGDQPNGGQVTFSTGTGQRLNILAAIEPANVFSFGETTRNKKKGTATQTLDLPGPGDLAVAGNGVKEASAAGVGATPAMSVPAAGTVQLTIKASGKKRKKLNRTGKVKVEPHITYTPTGGSPNAQSTTLKLKKR